MKEIWKDVLGYEGLYSVSNLGRIKAYYRRVDSGKCHREWKEHILYCAKDGCGYYRTNLAKNGHNHTVKVHRIVAQAFLPNPDNLPEVNHKNGDKTDNRVENLEWCTRSYNIKHSIDLGLKTKLFKNGSKNVSAKLSDEDVDWIRNHYKHRDKEFGISKIAKKFNVNRATIGRIVNNHTWKK